jgi:hypothetical protein
VSADPCVAAARLSMGLRLSWLTGTASRRYATECRALGVSRVDRLLALIADVVDADA